MTLKRNQIGGMAALSATLALFYGCGGGNGTAQTTTVLPIPATFTTIDGPGGSPTTLNGISSGGAVVGFTTSNGTNANFLRSAAGAFTALSVGDAAAGMANAVNSQNTIVGVANNSAFVLANGTQAALTVPNSTSSIAFGVNDGGVIVGQYAAATGGTTPGFVDINGAFTTITPTTAATVTNAQGVNNKGLVIGFYSADGAHQHGFTYDINSKQVTLLPDPATPRIVSGGLVLTQFLGLNDNNEAVGYYQTTNGSQFGFLFNLSTKTYAYLDDPLAAPVNGVQITQITGVSNAGVISGFYIDANGVTRGFIGTPPAH